MFKTEFVEEIKTHITFSDLFSKIVPFLRQCGKTW